MRSRGCALAYRAPDVEGRASECRPSTLHPLCRDQPETEVRRCGRKCHYHALDDGVLMSVDIDRRESGRGLWRQPRFALEPVNGAPLVDDPAHRLREGEEGNVCPIAPSGLRDGGIFSPPGAGIESVELRVAGGGVLGPVDLREGRRHEGLRSVLETNSSECRIRCTTQVWMTVSGKTALIASGNPFRPSTTAMRMSPTPRFLSSS